MDYELKPCPFCNFTLPKMGDRSHFSPYSQSESFVYCPACRSQGPVYNSAFDAAKAWNADSVKRPKKMTLEEAIDVIFEPLAAIVALKEHLKNAKEGDGG